MKIKRNDCRQPVLTCLVCKKETAILTYEENRLYRVSCVCGYIHEFYHVSELYAIEHCNNLLKITQLQAEVNHFKQIATETYYRNIILNRP